MIDGMSFHSWSKLAIYEYIQIQFELIHIVLTKHVNIYIITREQLEEGLKNRNLKPEFAKDNSGSFYWNRIIFFDIAVPVNPESEFRILVPVPAEQEPEMGIYRIYGRNLPEFIFLKFILLYIILF